MLEGWQRFKQQRAERREERLREVNTTLEEQLLNECGAMMRYASAAGKQVPSGAASTVGALALERDATPPSQWRTTPDNLRALAVAHAQLARLVAPATPQSLTVVNEQRAASRFWQVLGPVRPMRWMLVLGVVLLFGFIALLSADTVDPTQAVADAEAARSPSWTTRLLSAAYLASAAGLGAVFGGLFRLNSRIGSGQYDPKEESSYLTMIVLGVMAGVVLAAVVAEGVDGFGDDKLSPPLLALLGGFSVPAVHRILERLVETLETLIQGNAQDRVAAEVEAATARLTAAAEQDRTRLAASALPLRSVVDREDIPEDVRTRLQAFMQEALPDVEPAPRP